MRSHFTRTAYVNSVLTSIHVEPQLFVLCLVRCIRWIWGPGVRRSWLGIEPQVTLSFLSHEGVSCWATWMLICLFLVGLTWRVGGACSSLSKGCICAQSLQLLIISQHHHSVWEPIRGETGSIVPDLFQEDGREGDCGWIYASPEAGLFKKSLFYCLVSDETGLIPFWCHSVSKKMRLFMVQTYSKAVNVKGY